MHLSEVDKKLLDGFTCGDETIDSWLHEKAALWCRIGRCAVHVAVDSMGCPAGFFSLSSRGIYSGGLRRKDRHGKSELEFSTWLIGYLGVREDLQRTPARCGTALLDHAIKKAYVLSHDGGGSFVTIDPINESVRDWYCRYGFEESVDPESGTLYLPMKRAASMIEELGEEYFVF